MSTPLPPSPAPQSKKRNRLLRAILVLLVIGGGIAVYAFWPKPKPPEDMAGAMAANTRGIGQLEKYEYKKATGEFEEAVKLAPNWLPARINLAIALMNENQVETKARAEVLLREALKREPDSKHAHFCLGIVLYDRTQFQEAHEHFAAVNKRDPEDAHTWFRVGQTHPQGTDSVEARRCFEEAVKRDPYLNAARYNLFLGLRVDDPERAMQVLADFEALKAARWEHLSGIVYTEMGKYAEAIGSSEKSGKPEIGPLPMFEVPKEFKVTLAAGSRWAAAADLDPHRKAARERFGAAIVLFDFNRDGKPDIFIPSAVVENGKVRDVLLKNEGNFAFTDATAAAGLATPRPSLGAAAADYDNDGQIDLVITGAGEQHLFRNLGDGKFEDVSVAVGLDRVKSVCLGCGWADLDQDGDLDLLLCRYSDSATNFTPSAQPTGGIELFENVGVYPPARPVAIMGQPTLVGLTTKFRRDDRLSKVVPPCSAVGLVISDLDNDGDLDLLVLADGNEPIFLSNDRLMRFQRAERTWMTDQKRRWNGGLVLAVNHDECSDLILVSETAPLSLMSAKNGKDFDAFPTNSPVLKQAVAADIDRDSWTDIVGLGADGKPVLLHNLGDGKLEKVDAAFGDAPVSLGVAVADVDGNCTPDLVLFTEAGLQIRRGLSNGNAAVYVDPTGRRKPTAQGLPGPERTNADGIGSRLALAAGTLHPEAERTTVSAGLGQSMLPTALGIGKAGQADLLRIRWPDQVQQAELGIAGCAGGFKLVELERKPDSCPTLMTWDGEKFVFVTDILGGGALGEREADGSVRPPRPEESVKIEHWQLKPRDGQYALKIAEPMDEVTYLDRVRLDVVDHPVGVEVYPDERFATANPQPTQELLAFKKRYFPKLAIDHRGTDVTKLLLKRDRKMVEGFALRSWLGFAEDHALMIDFGEVSSGTTGDNWYLVLAGWTEYAYPESIYAAARAGISLNVPVLERLASDGKTWEPLGDLGFPAGLPRVMTCPIPNFRPGKCALRIRTNLQVYWDQVYLARSEDLGAMAKVTPLEVASADIAYRGFVQEVFPDGRPPVSYDDAKTEAVSVTKWKGNLTRLGDATELLRAFDDRFAICGPGDEITVRFDATKLPELPAGWQRSFVLRSAGYCKGTAPTTATGGIVGPLPFRAMPNYPDFGSAKPPVTDADRWHTRPASGK